MTDNFRPKTCEVRIFEIDSVANVYFVVSFQSLTVIFGEAEADPVGNQSQ